MFAAGKTSGASAGGTVDPQFNYVTMLLHGDGTNGAQNNTFLDSSTNNFTITRNGNTTQGSFSPYGANWSNFFSYNATAVNYLVSSSVSLSGDFTIEGYVYWDGVGSNANMFTLGDSFLTTGMEIYIDSGNWLFWASNAPRITGSAAVKGQWTYLALTRSGTTVTMYINGVSQGTWTSSQTFSGTIKVGAEFYNGTYYPSMSGYISNFRVNNTTAINAVPTAPLTAISGTIFLTCQSNRFVDNSASPLTITVNGTPSVQRFNPFGASTAYDTSVIGGSGYFDGTGDSLSLATATALGTGNVTVEFWFYPTDISATYRDIYEGRSSVNSNTGLAIFQYGQTIEIYGNGLKVSSAASAFTANAWTHFAVVRTSGTCQIYINGVASGSSGSYSDNFTSTVRKIGDAINSFPFIGYISNLREVTSAVYSATFTPPTAPVTAITNTSLLTNFTNGAIFDNAMMNDLETVGNAQISTSVVKYGTGSLYFDGTGDYLLGPSTPNMSFGAGDFTVEAWVYAQGTSGNNQTIFQKGRGGSSNLEFSMSLNGSNQLTCFYTTDGSTVVQPVASSNTVSLSTWTHVAISRSGSTWRCFVDGTLRDSQTYAVTLYTGTGPISSGANPIGDNPLTGYIDELRITKGYARYTANFTPPTAAFPNTGPY